MPLCAPLSFIYVGHSSKGGSRCIRFDDGGLLLHMRFGGWITKRLDHLTGSRKYHNYISTLIIRCFTVLFSAFNGLNASADIEIYPYVMWMAIWFLSQG